MTLPLAKAEQISILVEVALYAAYCILFCTCLWGIFYKKSIHPVLSFASFTTFLLSTVFLILDLRRFLGNFVVQGDPTIGVYKSSQAQTGKVTKAIDLFPHCIQMANLVIADVILIWRCFVIWGRNIWVCSPSIFLLVGTTISGIGGIIAMTKQIPPTRWGHATLALIIFTNTMTTGLIAWRIWMHKRQYEKDFGKGTKYTRYCRVVIALVIETGALYTATMIIYFILYVSAYDSAWVIVDRAQDQIVGIVPTLILVYTTITKSLETEAPPAAEMSSHDITFADTIIEIGPIDSSRISCHHLENGSTQNRFGQGHSGQSETSIPLDTSSESTTTRSDGVPRVNVHFGAPSASSMGSWK